MEAVIVAIVLNAPHLTIRINSSDPFVRYIYTFHTFLSDVLARQEKHSSVLVCLHGLFPMSLSSSVALALANYFETGDI